MNTATQTARSLLPRFPLGVVSITPGAQASLAEDPSSIYSFLRRHSCADWGDLCEQDKEANDLALQHGGRLLSVYHMDKIKVYVITEYDRSLTSVLLPEEY